MVGTEVLSLWIVALLALIVVLVGVVVVLLARLLPIHLRVQPREAVAVSLRGDRRLRP